MSVYGDGCECVQGIEVFIDPRYYTPTYGMEAQTFTLPIWEQNFIEAYNKRLAEEVKAEEETDVSVSTKQVIDLVVLGNKLTNKYFESIYAYQLNTYSVKLESIDTTWTEAEGVSLIFSHEKLDESVIVPVEELGKAVKIPNQVLIPGKLSITACTVDSEGEISSTVTNSIDYNVYAPAVKPINFGKIHDFELYYYFLGTVNKLKADYTTTNTKLQQLREEFDEYKRTHP